MKKALLILGAVLLSSCSSRPPEAFVVRPTKQMILTLTSMDDDVWYNGFMWSNQHFYFRSITNEGTVYDSLDFPNYNVLSSVLQLYRKNLNSPTCYNVGNVQGNNYPYIVSLCNKETK
jgi:hypothetical protein